MGYLVAVQHVAIHLSVFFHNIGIDLYLSSTHIPDTIIIFSLHSVHCIALITGSYILVSFPHIFEWENYCLFYSLPKVVSQKCHKLTVLIPSLPLGNGSQAVPTNTLQASLQTQRASGTTAFRRRVK